MTVRMQSDLIQIEQPSSVAVKGCSFIYAPAGQAGEYAPLAANPYRGCGHKCCYCYVPLITRQKRPEFDAGAVARPRFLDNLRKDAWKYLAAGITEQVLLSFTTDVYNPFDTTLPRPTIEILREFGLAFCVLTKGGGPLSYSVAVAASFSPSPADIFRLLFSYTCLHGPGRPAPGSRDCKLRQHCGGNPN